MTCDAENTSPVLEQAQTCGRVKTVRMTVRFSSAITNRVFDFQSRS